MKPLGKRRQRKATVLQLCHLLQKQAVIIFSFCSLKYCTAMNLIISPRISIYCCNAMQQRYKHSVISAFLWVHLIFLTQGLFLLKCDWVASLFRARHTATQGFTSQFPEVESNNGSAAEARRLWLLRTTRGREANVSAGWGLGLSPCFQYESNLHPSTGGHPDEQALVRVRGVWLQTDVELERYRNTSAPLRKHVTSFRPMKTSLWSS